ncbi:NHLP family bacteriocin export ABC transporter peptidase/permease/ATPase subunit [Altericista sp. CCNU0014]|uniref:NHLP family bacteriocin export ABC transporter peptidase/permease/ATPase subunit n=1 Tax=Altericista sp. CCNU0014 TaxID=3082949 RepID=UPI00384A6B01
MNAVSSLLQSILPPNVALPASHPSPRTRTPTLLQMEAVECGAAALGIVLGYYKRIVPLADLRQACGVSRDGSKASSLVKAARSYGLLAKGYQKNLDSVQKMRCPLVVFWNFNHFLVVEGFGKNKVYLNDPATGPRTVSLPEFDAAFTGVVLAFEPGPEFSPGGSKPSTLAALYRRLQGSWGVLIYAIIIGLFLIVPRLAIPVFTQVFVDNILIEKMQDWVRPLLIAMAVAAGLKGMLKYLQLKHLRQLQVKLGIHFSGQLLWHMLRLPVSFYAQRFAGEIGSRLNLNNNVAQLLSGQLTTTSIDALVMLLFGIVMWQYDWGLTLIVFGFAALNFLAVQWAARARVDTSLRLATEYGKAKGVAIAGLMSLETLKASALESDFFGRWSGYQAKALNAQQSLGLQSQFLNLLPALLSTATTLLVLVVGGLKVMNGDLTIGMLVAFQSLTGSFLEPIASLVGLSSSLQDLESDLNRLDDVLANPIDAASDRAETERTALMADFRLKGALELRGITFGYNPIEPPLIENFSLTLRPGQRIAIVGNSGSGKSTIAKLISGLYDPWAGEIFLDGQPRDAVHRRSLYESLALIDQDIFLFADTVRQNLTLWDATVPDDNLIRACRDADIEDVVLDRAGGFDAQLLEGGVNLSGGQRQRLEIARALVNNPSILVLDEATSALDGETEAKVIQNIRRRGCTCVVIAHRLSTIRDCDEIVVLERGSVVQRGSHEDLIATEGAYAKLIRSEAAQE